jgi:hypothetical protein
MRMRPRLPSYGGISSMTLLPTWFVKSCLPGLSDEPRSSLQWLHEIKHDGYRVMVLRQPTEGGLCLTFNRF